jgi:hypothetical protein
MEFGPQQPEGILVAALGRTEILLEVEGFFGRTV